MQVLRRAVSLLVVLAVEAVAVVTLHRLGARAPFDLPIDDLEPWLRAAPADAVAAALRVVALVFAWWLVVATLAYACASAVAIPAAVRVCAWATPRSIRRTVDRALAASLVAGMVTSPSGAMFAGADAVPRPQVSIDVRSGRSLESLPAEEPPPPEAAPPVEGSLAEVAAEPPVSAGTDATASVVVVAPGDSLWELSASALAAAAGRERSALDDGAIAAYWRMVCDANRDGLRSDDVNLIYPGEVVELPPVR